MPESPRDAHPVLSNRFVHFLAFAAAMLLLTAHLTDGETLEKHEQAELPWPGDVILYALEVHGPEGELLFRPRVLGEADRPARLDLMGESERHGPLEPRLRLLLDGLAARDGLDLSMHLTVGGLVENYSFRLRMPMNERQSISVPTDDGRSMEISLRAFKVGTDAFHAYMEAMERRALTQGTPEA